MSFTLVGGYKCLMFLMVIFFCFVGWSSNSWFMAWMNMELLLVVFVGFMACDTGYKCAEAMIKYFLTQVFFSLLIVFFFFFFSFCSVSIMTEMILFIFMSKVGMFPFHGWIVGILGKVGWWSFFVMMTFLKMIPILFIYYSSNEYGLLVMFVFSGAFGSLLGLNNLMIQKLMAYSSMVHLSWALIGLFSGNIIFYFYIFSYLVMMYYIISLCDNLGSFHMINLKVSSGNFSVKLSFILMVLSLGGFPPLLGFLFKWLIILMGCTVSGLAILIISFSSSLSLFFYFQLFYYYTMVHSLGVKWDKTISWGSGSILFISSFSLLSLWFFWC